MSFFFLPLRHLGFQISRPLLSKYKQVINFYSLSEIIRKRTEIIRKPYAFW